MSDEEYDTITDESFQKLCGAQLCYFCPECDNACRTDYTLCPRYPKEHGANGICDYRSRSTQRRWKDVEASRKTEKKRRLRRREAEPSLFVATAE